jgi:hypothetical protein
MTGFVPKENTKWLILLTILVLTFSAPEIISADGDPQRSEIIEVDYTAYEWWLVYWDDDSLACEILVEHDLEPTWIEIFNQCGEDIYDEWIDSEPCYEAGTNNESTCSGMYLLPIGTKQETKQVEIELPVPRIWAEVQGCDVISGDGICSEIPNLIITAEEPLPNESIIRIQGTINEIPFNCESSTCDLVLRDTGEEGIALEFWADSSFGDSTRHYTGRIRVAQIVSEASQDEGWKVDIISDQNEFNNLSGCGRIWMSFPPLGTPPEWLSNPLDTHLLETDFPYTYLAGQLIQAGYVDNSSCTDLGLMENGYASQCGMEVSRPVVNEWQNSFDEYIIEASIEFGIPSQLSKRIFARESQFWPATVKQLYHEYGLGHINELGADTVLFWNRDFYDQFCPLILDNEICITGYSQLDDWHQVLLRGAFLAHVEIDLPVSNQKIDPIQAQESVRLFSEALLANCSQVAQIINYELDQVPGDIISYEDLWKFTLVNYHAGAGCLSDAVQEVTADELPLSWETLSSKLEQVCPESVNYVEDITQ